MNCNLERRKNLTLTSTKSTHINAVYHDMATKEIMHGETYRQIKRIGNQAPV
jgi:hypothetical protein